MEFDRTAALKSASWGRLRILGHNHASTDYGNINDSVPAMYASGARHLEAFPSCLRASHLDDELRGKNRATFASGDNGKTYAENHFDVKPKAA